MKCATCGMEIAEDSVMEISGKKVCEDCYIDISAKPKACDPWAVHSAQTFLKGKDKLSTLTHLQLNIVNYIKGRGEATIEEMVENLNLTEGELRREFAVLRHMEILKATKKGEKIFYILF